MQRCNPIYTLKNRLKDETGITLVELIAAISLLMIVILLAGAIHMFGQRQFKTQTESASQANDFSYALTVMTTELRKSQPDLVVVENGNKIIIDGVEVFWQKGDKLYHLGSVIAEDIGEFIPKKDDDSIEITITQKNHTASDKKYHTRIYFRGVP